MASNKNNKNNPNQPRRKRNKKPVKRYSEEYSNRPNPYTGYSADGNYHPEAKKHPIDDASAVKAAREAEEARRAAINAAMADAVFPPAAAGYVPQQPIPPQAYVPPTVTIPPPKWAASNNMTQQQTAVSDESRPAPAVSEPSHQEPPTQAAHDEGADADTSPSEAEASRSEEAGGSTHRSGSHRKKHANREEAKKAKKAKLEAKKAAVDKIAKGVAAHSVSEQMIDDIASMSDVIGNMSKAEPTKPEVGVNWEELYDAAFPPKESESEKSAGKKVRAAKRRMEVEETAASDAPMLVKPVMLGDDDLLPFDKIVRENAREAEEARAAVFDETAETIPESESAQEEHFVNPPLEPSDLIPVLDFDKPAEPSQEEADESPAAQSEADTPDNIWDEAVVAAEEEAGDVVDIVSAASIQSILNAVEQEKRDTVIKANAITRGAELALGGDFVFDTDKSEGWHEIFPPPMDDSQPEQPTDDADDVGLLSKRLLESYMELENQPQQTVYDDEEDEDGQWELSDSAIEMVDLNEFLKSANPSALTPEASQEEEPLVEMTVEPEEDLSPVVEDTPIEEKAETASDDQEAAAPVEEAPASSDMSVEIDISAIEDEIFGETEISQPEEGAQDTESVEQEQPSGDHAVKEKIEKLVEAAELAEVLRQESEDHLPEPEQELDSINIFNIDLHLDDLPVIPEVTKDSDSDEEVIREYQPRRKAPETDEKVFESVLIIEDNQNDLDSDAYADQDDTLFLHSKEPSENPTAVFKLPEGPIVLPTDIDDGDFQEQWLDEDEDGDEMASRTKRARRRVSAFIGAVTIMFALVILAGVVRTVVNGFTNIGSTGEKKAEYIEFVAPVVLNDPAPFESVEKADNQMLLESAIWRVLDEVGKTENYEYTYDATDKIVLSAEKVEQAGKALFGKDVQLNMNVLSESDGSAIYYYDSFDNSFHISTGGITGPTAVITKIAQKSDYVSLIVGYSSQAEMTLTSSESSEVDCYKYMEYVLAFNDDGSYYIQSIRNYVEE